MKITVIPVAICIATSACASTMPTPELVRAREAYSRAERAEETKYSSASLLGAKQALNKAERIHKDDPQSNEERSYAYVAERRAELAVIEGAILRDRNQRAALEQRYHELQDDQRQAAEQQLDVSQDRVRNLNSQLSTQRERSEATQLELERERQRTRAALASLEKIAQVKEESRGTVLTLSGQVLFVTGKSELLPTAREQLEQVAQALQQSDTRSMVVEGHTDSRGDEAMNMKLSQERAQAVRSFLIGAGVPQDKISAIGRGEATPIATNDTPEGRANNRRVEIVLNGDSRNANSPASGSAAGSPQGGAGTNGNNNRSSNESGSNAPQGTR